MTYTYSGDPSFSDLDWIRFTIGDTAASWEYSNEEISGVLAVEGDRGRTAGKLLRRWALRLMKLPSFSIGRFSEQYQAVADAMNKLADQLLKETMTPGVYAGGISASDKGTREADGDRVEPAFKRGLMELR